jgi:hypothetical protein
MLPADRVQAHVHGEMPWLEKASGQVMLFRHGKQEH